VRNSIWATFYKDYLVAVTSAVIAEGITVSYVYFLFYLISYLKDPLAPYTDGIWLVCVYSFAIALSTLFRNYYIFLGYVIAIRMRKAIVSAMYDKVGKLSTKSLTETNSGKLITIISGDIFNVERAICMMPILPAAPLVTLLCLFYIAWGSGIEYAVITLIIWLGCLGGQAICNIYTRKYKAQEARLTDNRMKLINDLVSGIRTVKSYAWENHYLKKISEVRAKQHTTVFKHNMVGSLGYTFF
jgi:ATP-binding cassette, subfamily C (CFTR/MRP), member 4